MYSSRMYATELQTPTKPWCSYCKVTIVCSKTSSPTSRSSPIDLPLPRKIGNQSLIKTSSGRRRWLIFLGDIVRVVFGLRPWWAPNVGIKLPRAPRSRTREDTKVGSRTLGGYKDSNSAMNSSKCSFFSLSWENPEGAYF
jgi:hypothetical protein